MTDIEGISGPTPPRPISRAARREAGFRLPEEASAAETEESAPAGEAAPAAALGGMLALQEAGVETVRDRAARRRGHVLLAALSRLQGELLGAGPGATGLSQIAELAENLPPADDPRLADVLAAIGLRIRVECARRERT